MQWVRYTGEVLAHIVVMLVGIRKACADTRRYLAERRYVSRRRELHGKEAAFPALVSVVTALLITSLLAVSLLRVLARSS